MNEEMKIVAAPADPGPVVSQAITAPANATDPAVPTSPDAPIPLSQVPTGGWSGVNLSQGSKVVPPAPLAT